MMQYIAFAIYRDTKRLPLSPLSDNAFFDYRNNFTIIQNDAIYHDNIAIIFKRYIDEKCL